MQRPQSPGAVLLSAPNRTPEDRYGKRLVRWFTNPVALQLAGLFAATLYFLLSLIYDIYFWAWPARAPTARCGVLVQNVILAPLTSRIGDKRVLCPIPG
jgi:hypothetical protein